MTSISITANKFYPGIPDVDDSVESHTVALKAVTDALLTHERRDNNYLKSFVRFEELVDLGLIDSLGEFALTLTGTASEVNDLSSVVTWADVPSANITEASVTQHQSALTILESQITDGSILARLAADEAISGAWTFNTPLKVRTNIVTATPPTSEAVTGTYDIYDLDGTDQLAQFGYAGGSPLFISSFMHGADIRIRGEDSSGDMQFIFIGNPGGSANLYNAGTIKLSTASDGIDVTGDIGGTTIGGITEANLVDKTATEIISGTWTHSGQLVTDDSTTTRAGFNIPTGVAPSSPVQGDIWVTSTDILAHINGIDASILFPFYEITSAETTAGVIPTNFQYEPGNVPRYGAVGDGAINDTTALSNALSVDQRVFGRHGDTYLTSGVTQSIDGQVIDFSGCILKLTASQSNPILAVSGDNVEIIGGTYDGNKAAGQSTTSSFFDHSGVSLTGDYCTIRNAISQNSAGLGFSSKGGNFNLVTECLIKDFDVSAIYFESVLADAFGNRIIGNRIEYGTNSHGGAINMFGKSDRTFLQFKWIISHNIIKGRTSGTTTADGGITIRSEDGVCSDNVVEGTTIGISADAADNSVISNNVIFDQTTAPGFGIELGGSNNSITGNTIKNCIFGIIGTDTSENFDSNNISGNNIQDVTTNHIHFVPALGKTAQYINITGNTLTWASGTTGNAGISLSNDCKYILISGNNFIGPGSANTQARGVKIISGPGHVSVIGNRFSGIYRPFDTFSSLSDTFVDGNVNTGTDQITLTTHSFVSNIVVQLTTTGTLPAGLALATDYYVKRIDDNTVELYSDADLSSIVDITAAASGGTHTIAASSITNLNFSNNDCSNDMPNDNLFMITSGAAGLAANCVQMNNIISTGLGRNYSDRLNNVLTLASTGTPEGVVTAAIGSVFYRTDGSAVTSIYIKESGTSSAGWVAK